MKIKYTLPLLAGTSVLALTSCKNPADETADATVSEAAPEATVSGGTTYIFTDSSTISFVGSKVTGSHEGGFKTFKGNFVVKNGEPQGGNFTIDMNSTWSDNDKLTEHLKAPDFFNVASFPSTAFVVTNFAKEAGNTYQVSGNLTLHGVTKNITFPTTASTSEDSIKVSSEFDIKRSDFGITYPGKKDDLIRDEVIIKFNLSAEPAV
ncbi:MAG: YceI family protein [Roseibacillus sp.]